MKATSNPVARQRWDRGYRWAWRNKSATKQCPANGLKSGELTGHNTTALTCRDRHHPSRGKSACQLEFGEDMVGTKRPESARRILRGGGSCKPVKDGAAFPRRVCVLEVGNFVIGNVVPPLQQGSDRRSDMPDGKQGVLVTMGDVDG